MKDNALDSVPAVSSFAAALSCGPKAIDLNPARVYIASLHAERSKRVISDILRRVAQEAGFSGIDACPWHSLSYEAVLAIKIRMEQAKLAPSTVALCLSALRGVAKNAWLLGKLSDHNLMAIRSISRTAGSRLPRGRALDTVETGTLISQSEKHGESIAGIRDAAILALGVGCGLRRAELAQCRIDCLREEDHSLRIIGKGDKERLVFPSDAVWKRLMRWLGIRGREGSPTLFVAIYQEKILLNRPLTDAGIYRIVKRRQKEFGIAPFSPHDMRRTYATRMLDAGADLDTVRDALGHASCITTQRYDRRGLRTVQTFSQRIPL